VTLVMVGAACVSGGPPGSGQHAATMAYLLSLGAPPNTPDIAGMTALHHAATNARSDAGVVRALLHAGGNPDARNRYGEVPLMLGIQTAAFDVIDALMEAGASLDIPDADDLTPRSALLSPATALLIRSRASGCSLSAAGRR
jgi:ankyrin repeat protein